jgi:hypothetical protein
MRIFLFLGAHSAPLCASHSLELGKSGAWTLRRLTNDAPFSDCEFHGGVKTSSDGLESSGPEEA